MKSFHFLLFLFFFLAAVSYAAKGIFAHLSNSCQLNACIDPDNSRLPDPKDVESKVEDLKNHADKIARKGEPEKVKVGSGKKEKKAEAKGDLKPVETPEDVLHITWDMRVFGVLFLAIGFLLTFSGKRFFKVFLGCSGFLAFAILAVTLLSLFESNIYVFESPKWIYISFAGISGLLGAALCVFLWEIGILACAGFGGYSLAIWIMSMKAGGAIESFIGRGAFVAAVTVIAIIFAWFFDNIAIIIASALAGALSIVVGFDCFVNWGLMAVILNIIVPGNFAKLKHLDTYCYLEIAAVAVLAVLGLVIQFLNGSKGKGYTRSDKV